MTKEEIIQGLYRGDSRAIKEAIKVLERQPSDCPLVEIKEHKLERIEQIVERFKSQYDHTSNLDLMIEIKEILEQE